MSISIALCTYNGARYLLRQLESIAQQSVLPEEIVICDDRSTDATIQVVEEFAKDAPFKVRLFLNEQNLGYLKNFEQAIMLCEGDLIALSDQDDIWYPHKLAVLSAHFQKDELTGGVFSDGDLMDEASQPLGRTLWQNLRFTSAEQDQMRAGFGAEVLFRRNVVTGMTLMFRSSLRDRLLPIPENWIHDAWFAFMLLLHSTLYPCAESLVQYRTHADQQVGPPLSRAQKFVLLGRHGVSAYLNRVRSVNVKEYANVEDRFGDLAEIAKRHDGDASRSLFRDASAKVSHARAASAALSLPRRRRYKAVLSHAREYQRYSFRGLRDMVRDLLI